VVAEWGDGEQAEAATDAEGKALVPLPPNVDVLVKATKAKCQDASATTHTPVDSINVEMNCKLAPELAACLGISTDMESTMLTSPDGYPARACEVRVHPAWDLTKAINVGWRVDAAGTLLISEPKEECPAKTDSISIDCDGLTYSQTLATFLDDIKMHNVITLTPKAPAQKPDPKQLSDDQLVRLPQHITSQYGVPLEGVRVLAVDEDGNPLDLSTFGNVATECTTDSNGDCTIILPKGQDYRITTNDPRNAYQAVVDPTVYTADAADALTVNNLKAAEGFETKIYVKQADRQYPIPGASIEITKDGKHIGYPVYTNGKGEAIVVLLKDTSYEMLVRHPQFDPVNTNVTGDVDMTVFMDKVDITTTGDLAITVTNEHREKDPLIGVRIKLIDGNGTMYSQSITNDAGQVYFGNILPDTYTIQALPNGGVTYQSKGTATVTPQNVTETHIEVLPVQVKLTIYPLIEIEKDNFVRKEGVRVEIWNAYYEELEQTKVTAQERKIDFSIDRGTDLYFIVTFEERGKKYGPEVTEPELYYTDQPVDIYVHEQPQDVTVGMQMVDDHNNVLPTNAQLNRTRYYYARLSVALPEFSVKTPYETTELEFFAGEPGQLRDTTQTPIVITDMALNDIATEDPFVESLTKANDYQYGQEPTPDDEGLSKYVKVTLGKYTPIRTYTLNVPLYVREIGPNGVTHFSYRAIWTTPDGRKVYSGDGKWTTVAYTISPGHTNWYPLAEGPFYSYDHCISQDKASFYSETFSCPTEITVSQKAYFYYLVQAQAREPMDSWEIPLDIMPSKATPIAYEGNIWRTGQSTPTAITQVPMTGKSIKSAGGLYGLNKDDRLVLVVTFRADQAGTGSIIAFKDVDHPRSYQIDETPALQKETLVSGVTAKLSALAMFLPDMETQYRGVSIGIIHLPYDAPYNPTIETLPTNGKQFTLNFAFDNIGNAKNMKLRLTSKDTGITFNRYAVGNAPSVAGSVTYVQEVEFTVPANTLGSTVSIYAQGTSGAESTIDTLIWEQTTPTPTEPWASLKIGPVDYHIEAFPYSGNSVEPFISSESTDELRVKLYRTTAGKEEELKDQGWLNGDTVAISGIGQARWNKDGYYVKELSPTTPIPPGTTSLTFTTSGKKFGGLELAKDAASLAFSPAYPGTLTLANSISYGGSGELTLVTVTNNYDEAVKLTIKPPAVDGWKVTLSGDAAAYNDVTKLYDIKVDSYDDQSIRSVDLPAKAKLSITVKAQTSDVACGNAANAFLQIESTKLRKPVVYSAALQCTLLGAQAQAGEYPPASAYAAREPTDPASITMNSCLSIGDTNYICDAEQLSNAVLDAASYLAGNDDLQSVTMLYALGNDKMDAAALRETLGKRKFDKLGAVVADEGAGALTKAKDVVFSGSASCGIYQFALEKNQNGDIKATATQPELKDEKGDIIDMQPWCTRFSTGADYSYFLGLTNFDRDLRPLYGAYFSFEQGDDSKNFITAIQKSRDLGNDVNEALVLGYQAERLAPDTIRGSRVGGQAQTFLKWKECDLQRSADCPKWALQTMKDEAKKGAVNIVGYFNIDEYNDVQAGLVYDKTRITATGAAFTQLDAYRTAFVTRLMQYWQKGGCDSKGENCDFDKKTVKGADGTTDVYVWPSSERNFHMVYAPERDTLTDIVDLSGPKITDNKVTLYGFDLFGQEDTSLSGSSDVNLHLLTTEADYCAFANLNPDGTMGEQTQSTAFSTQTNTNGEITGYSLDDIISLLPGDGIRRVAAYCVKDGISSALAVGSISVDTTGLELVGYYPTVITMTSPTRDMPKITVRDRFGKAQSCWVTGGESPLGSEGYLNARGENPGKVCRNTVDENPLTTVTYKNADASYKTDDGCCETPVLEATPVQGTAEYSGLEQFFKISSVQCKSPYVDTPNKEMPAEVWCTDSVGNSRKVANTTLYRWSDDAPKFDLVNDFVFSENVQYDAANNTIYYYTFGRDFGITFDPKAGFDPIAERSTYGVYKDDKREFLTFNTEKGEFAQTVTSPDVWPWNVLTDSSVYVGTPPEMRFKPVDVDAGRFALAFSVTGKNTISTCGIQTSNSAKGEITNAVCDLKKLAGNATCETLLLEGVNTVTITCSDKVGTTRSDKIVITRDEKGPQVLIETLEQLNILGDIKDNVRQKTAKYRMQVKDDYSAISTCEMYAPFFTTKGETIESLPQTSATMECNPVSSDDNGKSKTFECSGNDYLGVGLLLAYNHDSIKIVCEDFVGNTALEGKTGAPIQTRKLTEANVKEDVVKMCQTIRYGMDSAAMLDAGYEDVSEYEDPAKWKVVPIKDGAGSDSFDEAGFMFPVRYSGTGEVKKDTLVDALDAKATAWQIWPRGADCATQVACQAVIDWISSGGLSALYAAQVRDTGAAAMKKGGWNVFRRFFLDFNTLQKDQVETLAKASVKRGETTLAKSVTEDVIDPVTKKIVTGEEGLDGIIARQGLEKAQRNADYIAQGATTKAFKGATKPNEYLDVVKSTMGEAKATQIEEAATKKATTITKVPDLQTHKWIDKATVDSTVKDAEIMKLSQEALKTETKNYVLKSAALDTKSTILQRVLSGVGAKWSRFRFFAATSMWRNLITKSAKTALWQKYVNPAQQAAEAAMVKAGESVDETESQSCQVSGEWRAESDLVEFVPLIGNSVKALTPSKLAFAVCGPGKITEGSYIMVANAQKINMEGMGAAGNNVAMQAMGACFDACDRFQCTVTIIPVTVKDQTD
jgi:hypothetical protein